MAWAAMQPTRQKPFVWLLQRIAPFSKTMLRFRVFPGLWTSNADQAGPGLRDRPHTRAPNRALTGDSPRGSIGCSIRWSNETNCLTCGTSC
jgi:hypothetical protein